MKRLVDYTAAAAFFALSLGLSSGAQAQILTPELGGDFGTHFTAACKTGDYLIGIAWTADKALNTVQPICIPQINGKWSGNEYALKVRGVAPDTGPFRFTPKGTIRCKRNQFVTALHVWWDKFGDVHHVKMFCHNSSRNSEFTDSTSNGGGEPNQDGSSPCPTTFFANALTGSSSNLVNRLGLRCIGI